MLLSIIALAGLATADQYKTIKQESKENRYEYSVSYPELLPGSVPAYAAISAQIKNSVVNSDCGTPEKDDPAYYYNAQASVVALNATYVGVAIASDTYCGGAHPNDGTSYLTFDSRTGNELKIARELGFKDYDDPEYDNDKMEARRKLLAELLVDKIPTGTSEDCYTGTRAEKVESLTSFYPVVQGLAKNKTVVIGIDPPHVASACRFDVRFTYPEVQSLINRGSYLHHWLR